MNFWTREKKLWWLPYLEALGGILILTGFFLEFYGISSLILPRFHPFLPLVLLIAARYGFLPGVVSALLGCLDYYLLLLWQDHWDSLMPGHFSFLWPSAFLFSGMIVGELRDGESRRYSDLESQFIKEKDAARTATLQVEILIKAKKELEKRVFLDPNLATELFDVFRSLEKDEVDSIPSTLLSLCISFVGADSVALYRRNRDHFFLEASAGFLQGPDRVDRSYLPFFRVYDLREPMTIRENGILPEIIFSSEKKHRPLCIYPVLSGEYRVEFLLVIWHAPFEKLTPDFFQMMRMIVDRASSRLEFLESHKKTRESVSIDESTGFLRPVFFARRAAEELSKSYRYQASFSLLEVSFRSNAGSKTDFRSALLSVREIVKRLLRDVDFSGLTGDGKGICLCLPHTSLAGAEVVQKKFLVLWDEILSSFPLLQEVRPVLQLYSFLPSGGRGENDDKLYHSLMIRLDSIFLQDPSTGFYSGQGFWRELQKEKQLGEKEAEKIGLIAICFETPSWEDVVLFGKALREMRNLEGKPLLAERTLIGIPLDGNSLWLLLPKTDLNALELIEGEVLNTWSETDIPRLKRGSLSIKARSFDPSDAFLEAENLNQLLNLTNWSEYFGA